MSNKQPPPHLNAKAIEAAIEKKVWQIWNYVRQYADSLSSETHTRRIREMVNVKFAHYENVVESLHGEIGLQRAENARRNRTIKDLRNERIRLKREIAKLQAELRAATTPESLFCTNNQGT